MPIRCGHCQGHHASAAEVRACHAGRGPTPGHQLSPGLSPELFPGVSPGPDGSGADADEGPERMVAAPVDGRAAGPDVLGRTLVVAAGAPVPAPWAQAERVVVDDAVLADPRPVVEHLQQLWSSRRRYVVDLRTDLARPPEDRFGGELWDLAPGFDHLGERLHHLVWASSAQVVAALDGPGTWGDGGPLHPGIGGLDVVHSVSVEHGSVAPLRTDPPAEDLAPDQLAAVGHRGGPTRIVAPAGSGKTRVLTARARHLLKDWGLPASAVALVAFNVRARREMVERTADLPALQVRTLNGLGLAILQGRPPFALPTSVAGGVRTIDERQVRAILGGIVGEGRRRRANVDPLAVWLDALRAVRLELRHPRRVEEALGDVEDLETVLRRYRDELAGRGLVDFDEQVARAVEVLARDPLTRRQAQRACRVLLVDEFQDLAPAHLLLVRLLAAPRFDVFGVGDDDQTIYGFTGASPEWLIDYDRFFPGAASHPLQVNYRCPEPVVSAAATLLTHNRRRVPKVMSAAEGRGGADGDLQVSVVDDPVAHTTGAVLELLAGGASRTDVAVLTRVNVSLVPVQVSLRAAGVPTVAAVGPDLVTHSGVAAALAWLRLADRRGRLSPADVATTARRPGRGCSATLVEWMAEQRSPADLRALAGRLQRQRDAAKVEAYAADLDGLAAVVAGGAATATALEYVRDVIGLGQALDQLDSSRRGVATRSPHRDEVDALVQLARLHPEPTGFEAWLRDALADDAGSDDAVHLSTVHRVKGQEWPHVVVHGADAGVLPHRLAADTEEERRVLHVAITRASVSTTVVAQAGHGSPFLAELTQPWTAPPPGEARRGRQEPDQGSPGLVKAAAAGTRSGDGTGSGPDLAVREGLRAWRRDRAAADGVPAYVVFSDRTLDDISSQLPRSAAQLVACHGIGPAKLEAYGDEILAVVEDLAAEDRPPRANNRTSRGSP